MSDSVFGPRIIQNLLDTDFYKITMMQAVLHNYPNAEVEWEFRCRNGEDLSPYLAEIRYQVEQLADVTVTHDQLAYLEKIPFIKPDFIRFLSLFRFNLRYVQVGLDDAGQLAIRVRGPWLHVILYEIPLLAIISEVRNRYRYREVVMEHVGERLYQKLDWLKAEASADELAGFQLADFGTRRRFSYRVQEQVVHILKRDFPGRLVGTSNVHLARELELKPIGTMAHDFANLTAVPISSRPSKTWYLRQRWRRNEKWQSSKAHSEGCVITPSKRLSQKSPTSSSGLPKRSHSPETTLSSSSIFLNAIAMSLVPASPRRCLREKACLLSMTDSVEPSFPASSSISQTAASAASAVPWERSYAM
jgi:hypothetical protein